MVRKSHLFALASIALLGVAAWGASAQSQKQSTVEEAAQSAAASAGTASTKTKERDAQFLQDTAAGAEAAMRRAATSTEEEFFKQGDRVKQQNEQQDEWFKDQLDKASKLTNQTAEDYMQQNGMEQADKPSPTFVVMLSQSMGRAGLKAAFQYGLDRPDVAFVFRGFAPGQEPAAMYKMLHDLVGRDPDKQVLVMLNPPAFTQHSVESVPTILKLDANEKVVARATGIANPAWLQGKIDNGAKGNLGKQGQTYTILEEDLIEVMKKKAANLNMDEEQERAKKTYFTNMQVLELPYAKEVRRRDVLAQVVVNDDIVDHEGVQRYKKGEVISMAEHMPTAPVLVIYNSQDPYHVAFAKKMVSRFPNKNVILMTTQVDREGGFATYIRQERDMGRPVYLLTDEVRSTFGIEKIPTLVKPLVDRFAVVEVPLSQGVSGNVDSHTQAR